MNVILISPSCQDENGNTPLRLASGKGHMETVKFFTEEKACDPLLRDKYGSTSPKFMKLHLEAA